VIRRVAGVLFSMLLMLNLAPPEVECTEHATHEAVSVSAGEGAAHADHHDDGAADAATPCEPSDNGDCCEAVESCSTTHALRSSHASTSPAVADRSVSVFGATAPAYLIRPPEPPPPKA